MALSDTKIRGVKSTGKAVKLFDGGGLFLLVKPTGGKLWRLKYRYDGKEKLLSLGAYPVITLADAREQRDEAKRFLIKGVDPGAVKKAQQRTHTAESETFKVIAREWHAKFINAWSPRYAAAIGSCMERDLFPWVGNRRIAEIKAPDLLSVLRRIESRGALTVAHWVRAIAGHVFRYAVSTGRAERDPSGDLLGALPPVNTILHAIKQAISYTRERGIG